MTDNSNGVNSRSLHPLSSFYIIPNVLDALGKFNLHNNPKKQIQSTLCIHGFHIHIFNQ
jgi:hypothetical protein